VGVSEEDVKKLQDQIAELHSNLDLEKQARQNAEKAKSIKEAEADDLRQQVEDEQRRVANAQKVAKQFETELEQLKESEAEWEDERDASATKIRGMTITQEELAKKLAAESDARFAVENNIKN